MRAWRCIGPIALLSFNCSTAFAGMPVKILVVEVDPVAPSSAAYEEAAHGISMSKWGASVDFNLAANLSTGPEFWAGNYSASGSADDDRTYRRQDLWPGEKEKLDAVRLRWNLTLWDSPEFMRGWFVRLGYSYTRVNSRANRFASTAGRGSSLPVMQSDVVSEQPDLVSDIRHGVAAGAGSRWLFLGNKLSMTIGASVTLNLVRKVSVDSKNELARSDYEDVIDTLPDTKISVRPTPEVNWGAGWAF